NSESKLKYPVKFVPGQPRKVALIYGEAYFKVSPSEQHRGADFEVQVNDMEAKVLGTEFNIKAYKDEEETTTTLVRGKVALQVAEAKTVLQPMQQAVLKNEAVDFAVKTVPNLNAVLWKEGKFSFRQKSLADIMKVLSRWYDMKVVFKQPELKEVEFTGTLEKQQPIEEIMNIIAQTNNLQYTFQDKTLIIE